MCGFLDDNLVDKWRLMMMKAQKGFTLIELMIVVENLKDTHFLLG